MSYKKIEILGKKLNHYTNKNSEIDFIINNTLALEVKETPVDKDYKKLSHRAKSLNIQDYALIGKEKSLNTETYIWGGSIK